MSVLRQHLYNDRFYYQTDKTFRFWPEGRSRQGVNLLREGPEMARRPSKILITDLDNTVNKPDTNPPAYDYIDSITEQNSYLHSKKEAVFKKLKALETSENSDAVAASLSDDFRIGELTMEQHLAACRYAVDNLKVATNFNSAMTKLRENGYTTLILSASPKDLVVMLDDRLRVESQASEGTEFHFDSHGKFQSFDLNLNETRAAKRDEMMQRSVFTRYGVEMMVDDNPRSVRSIMKLGYKKFYFMLGDIQPVTENVTIESKEIRYDFMKLVDRIKRLERALAVTMALNEGSYRNAVEAAHSVVYHGRRAATLSDYRFESEKERTLVQMRRYEEMMSGLAPWKRTGMKRDMVELALEGREKASKIILNRIVEKFYERFIEANISV